MKCLQESRPTTNADRYCADHRYVDTITLADASWAWRITLLMTAGRLQQAWCDVDVAGLQESTA